MICSESLWLPASSLVPVFYQECSHLQTKAVSKDLSLKMAFAKAAQTTSTSIARNVTTDLNASHAVRASSDQISRASAVRVDLVESAKRVEQAAATFAPRVSSSVMGSVKNADSLRIARKSIAMTLVVQSALMGTIQMKAFARLAHKLSLAAPHVNRLISASNVLVTISSWTKESVNVVKKAEIRSPIH